MIGVLSRQFFHTGKACYATSTGTSLGKLRKVTGYSISNCKKALEMFPDNLQKAEEWLHNEAKKMGWSKWNKIQNRTAVQGLIGVYSEDSLGIMVEVNCETDFVAKNIEFQQLVGNVLLGCFENEKQFTRRQHGDIEKHLLDESDLLSLKCQSFSIQELVNSAMCKFNEKTIVKRAVIMKTYNSDYGMSGLSHPSEICPTIPRATIGKFGALLAYQQNGVANEDIQLFGLNMCQHIIGMNPLSIGTEDFQHLYESDKIIVGDTGIQNPTIQAEKVPEDIENDKSNEHEETFKTDLKDSDESRLLFQSYLLEPNMHVYDYLWQKVKVLDFERFECGGERKKCEEIENVANVRM